jgi:ATP-dependent DNA helicase RecQ
LTDDLAQRFERREHNEINRITQVLTLLTGAECITNALARHFGEDRNKACGHCSFCRTGQEVVLPLSEHQDVIPADFPATEFSALRAKHPDALGEPRQAARFLCGLTSPGISRARLGRHALFGALEEMRFASVLDWCEV